MGIHDFREKARFFDAIKCRSLGPKGLSEGTQVIHVIAGIGEGSE